MRESHFETFEERRAQRERAALKNIATVVARAREDRLFGHYLVGHATKDSPVARALAIAMIASHQESVAAAHGGEPNSVLKKEQVPPITNAQETGEQVEDSPMWHNEPIFVGEQVAEDSDVVESPTLEVADGTVLRLPRTRRQERRTLRNRRRRRRKSEERDQRETAGKMNVWNS